MGGRGNWHCVYFASILGFGLTSPVGRATKPDTIIRKPSQPRIVDELHTLVTHSRTSDVLNTASKSELQQLADSCEALWNRRLDVLAAVDATQNRSGAERLRNDLNDLATLYSELLIRLSDPSSADSARTLAEQVRREAATDLPSAASIDLQE